jgi:hypothetical protein
MGGMTMRLGKQLLFVLPLIAIAAPAYANDLMFSEAAMPVVGLALLVWLTLGTILKYRFYEDFVFIGWGVLVMLLVIVFSLLHLELILMIWMIYLAILVVYFLFRRANVSEEARNLNLLFHGTFLAVVIIGGAVAKVLYWSRVGGFAAWSGWMEEMYPWFLLWFGIITVFVSLWFYIHVARKGGGIVKKDREPKVNEGAE